MLEQIHELLSHLSLLSLIAIAFAVILFVPPLCARVGLPAAVGLLLGGVGGGPDGRHITEEGMPAVTFRATFLPAIASLMVLAVCLPIHTSGFSTGSFAMQIIELAIYVPVVVFGLSAVGKWLFRRKGYTNEYQVGFTLMVIALAGVG